MKSPITGLEMKLTKEQRSMIFRKETFDIVFHYFREIQNLFWKTT